MSPQHELFIADYLRHFNASRAARTAGYAPAQAPRQGYELMRNPEIQQAIAVGVDALLRDTKADAGMILREWVLLAKADPNEIVQMRRCCCRYCWGQDGNYQRTQRERDRDYREYLRSEQALLEPFEEAGGVGYDRTREPNPTCYECFGEGVESLHLADTRDLSPGARALLAGIKQTKDGIEVKFHSKEKALENLAKHLGMLKEQVEVTGTLGLVERLAAARRRTAKPEEDDGSDLAG